MPTRTNITRGPHMGRRYPRRNDDSIIVNVLSIAHSLGWRGAAFAGGAALVFFTFLAPLILGALFTPPAANSQQVQATAVVFTSLGALWITASRWLGVGLFLAGEVLATFKFFTENREEDSGY